MSETVNEKRITKRDRFEEIKALLSDHPELVAFCDHELELLAKKNSADKKPTAKQTENADIKEGILAEMEDGVRYRIGDMVKTFASCKDMTSQRVSALISQLLKVGAVERVEEKRVAYFVKV